MTIRQKTFAALAVALATSVAAAALLSGAFVLRAAEMIDADDAARATLRARRAIVQDLDETARFVRDYAGWDDTYAYAANHNQDYIDANYGDDTFTTNRVSFVVIADEKDATLYAKGFDLERAAETPPPPQFRSVVIADGLARRARTSTKGLRGIWFLAGGPMLVAAHPILTSHFEGPPRGTLLAGRALSETELDRLRKVTDVDMTLLAWSDRRAPAEARAALNAAMSEPFTVRNESAEKKEGFSPFLDGLGEPSAMLRTSVPRERYRTARDRLVALVLLLLVPALVTGGVVARVMERSVLGRLTRLHEFVRGVQAKRELSARLDMPGHDEIADLGAAFNGMMQTLERDALERERAEEALRLAKFGLDNAAMSVFWITPDGQLQYVNDAACAVLGYTRAELLAMTLGDIDPSCPTERWARCWAGTRAADSTTVQTIHRAKDGREINVEVTINPFEFQGKRMIFAFARNITGRLRAEKERARLEEELRQATKMEAVGRLAGGVAHDFNNLLTGMVGHVEMAMSELSADHPVRPDLAEIWKAADRAASLTSQLLAFSRKQVIDPRVVDLNALIEDSTRMLKRLIGEDIELVFSPAPDLGRVRVDPHQLEQVLVNLVVNARDAMPNGGILSVATTNWTIDEAFAGGRPDCAPGEYVLLTVADSGVGMSPEVLERLFEPFFTTKSLGRGAGLGLSIVYGVIRQNNGFIDVESAPDAGTTFRIYLPLVSEMPDRREPEVLAAAPGGDETVLLVEDEEMVRNLARRVLERQGYRVVVAASGAEALRLFSERGAEIDLLLTDVVMPQMNGRELHEILKRSRPDLKAVFMSGYTEDVIARHGVIEPGMHFLQKPFSVDLLIRKVRGALDN